MLGSACNSDGLVSNTLQIRADLHCRNDLPHIGCNRVKPKQQVDSLLIRLLFENVDLFIFIFCNDMVAEFADSEEVNPLSAFCAACRLRPREGQPSPPAR